MTLTFEDLLGPAGIVLVLLAVLSVISLALILIKLGALWGVVSGEDRRLSALAAWGAGDQQSALAALQSGRAPADRVAAAVAQGLAAGRDGAALTTEAERLGEAEMADMRRHIRMLEVIAMTAPLLGLLGTVLGMIEAFRTLELAGGAANAAVLAGGIWQALLTTAAGLIVAIPAAVAAQLFSARIERAGHLMEDVVRGLTFSAPAPSGAPATAGAYG